MMNWDPGSQTVVSDLEVDTKEESGSLWEIRYPIVGGGPDDVVIVATTRPETMLGDTAVAVHPSDARYTHLVGKELDLPLTGRRIPIIADSFVDMTFGTGAVKVTPAHDANDYEASQRCKLPVLQVIDVHAKMIAPAPAKYVGMPIEKARAEVVADLEAGGFLGEVKPYKVPRGRSQRSGAVIEPMLMEQWWVRAAPLAEKAAAAVEQGKTRFVPELHTKTFMHWMTNIRDWCISRQLWWGHQIPAWHCDACAHITVARDAPAACKCGGTVHQDDDILDTWFSSALWPFSTLGWPDKTRGARHVLSERGAGHRPRHHLLLGRAHDDDGPPLHGEGPVQGRLPDVARDRRARRQDVQDQGQRDRSARRRARRDARPADRARRHREAAGRSGHAEEGAAQELPQGHPGHGRGCAALRADHAEHGQLAHPAVDQRVEGYRNFINKLWNASRFALMNLDGYDAERFEAQLITKAGRASLGVADRWILSRLQAVCAAVQEALEAYRFSEAANAIYHFVWNELCDWYIELAKRDLQQDENSTRSARRAGTSCRACSRPRSRPRCGCSIRSRRT